MSSNHNITAAVEAAVLVEVAIINHDERALLEAKGAWLEATAPGRLAACELGLACALAQRARERVRGEVIH